MIDPSPKNTQLEQAKKMFWDYACLHFFMTRDGVYEEYVGLGASPEQERRWRAEYIQYWIERLSNDDLSALGQLHSADAFEALDPIMRKAELGDDYSKLWYANAIWDLVIRHRPDERTRSMAVQLCIKIWSALKERADDISPDHAAIITPNMEALNATTPEEYVQNYATRQLQLYYERASRLSST